PQKRQLRLVAPQLGLGLGDVFLAWAGEGQLQRLPVEFQPRLALGDFLPAWTGEGQLQRLLVDGQLGHGLIQGGPGGVEILLAHGLYLRLVGEADRREALEALVPATSVDDPGLSRHDIGSGLRDLFGSAAVAELLDNRLLGRNLRSGLRDLFGSIAVVQPFHDLPLGGDLGCGLQNPRLQTTLVQPSQHLAAPNAVPFLGHHGGNPLAVVERELDLPQVNVPVQRQRLGGALRSGEPPPGAGRRADGDQQSDDDRSSHATASTIEKALRTGDWLRAFEVPVPWCRYLPRTYVA